MTDTSETQEATEDEGDKDYDAHIGAPLDPDYLVHLREEKD
jgi:hypothetical protein